MTKKASQNSCHSPVLGPQKHCTPKSSEAQRMAKGLSLAVASQTGLPRLQLEGQPPPGGLSMQGLHPELQGRECSWCMEIGTGSFLSETETARCFPPSQVTQRQLDRGPAAPPLRAIPRRADSPSFRQAHSSSPTRPLASHHTMHFRASIHHL